MQCSARGSSSALGTPRLRTNPSSRKETWTVVFEEGVTFAGKVASGRERSCRTETAKPAMSMAN